MTSFCLLLGFIGILCFGDVSSAPEGGSQAHCVIIRTKSCHVQQPGSWGNKLSPTFHWYLFLFIYFYIHLFIFEEPCDLGRHWHSCSELPFTGPAFASCGTELKFCTGQAITILLYDTPTLCLGYCKNYFSFFLSWKLNPGYVHSKTVVHNWAASPALL